ncbi:MAG: NUDIX hydrolase [Syntrophaceae bacterium]|nr:NUDIX hydrolase [Syntrophaceae bacterium]
MKVIPANASTVMLLRACPVAGIADIEILMVRRHLKSSFVPGYYVFPGGVVDHDDYGSGMENFIRETDRADATRILSDMRYPGQALGAWVAAIRETFEEVGILLAHRKDGAPVKIATEEERRRFCDYRKALTDGKIHFPQVLAAEELFLPLDRLHYFSHWITPEFLPLRYDVRFFVTLMPPDQEVIHDGVELTGHVWIRPAEAIRQYEKGRLDMVLPQIMTLEDIKHFKTVDEVIDAARKRHVPAVLTKIKRIGGKDVEVMPDGSGYESRPPVYSWPEKSD